MLWQRISETTAWQHDEFDHQFNQIKISSQKRKEKEQGSIVKTMSFTLYIVKLMIIYKNMVSF